MITEVSVTPVLTTHAGYAANDFVGTDATLLEFPLDFYAGVIHTAILVDFALQSVACELWLFDSSSVTPPNDSAAWTITDAHALSCIGIIPFSTYYASAANSVSIVTNAGIAFQTQGSKTIYGALVTRGAPSYASGDVTIKLEVLPLENI